MLANQADHRKIGTPGVRRWWPTILLAMALGLGFWPPVTTSAATAEPALRVAAGIPPLGYLLERLGGDAVAATILLPAGSDPHTFEPSPGQVAQLARAELYFSLNMPFEQLLLRKIAAGPRVVKVDGGIKKLPLAGHHHEAPRHSDDHDDHDDHHDHAQADAQHHDHATSGEHDPHVWLSPIGLAKIAAHIKDALVQVDPPRAAFYRDNYRELAAELEQLHTSISELLAPVAGHTIYVYHPAFGYFTNAYNLRQRAVEIGGKTPTPRQLQSLIKQARRDGVRVIFVQPQFDRQSAATIARAIDGEVVALDPLAPEVMTNFEKMARHIRRALDPSANNH
ncbi:MAG: zinc ABC transporter substrate-binding protein [Desulfurivibrio sp.]|nr:zinc ABC transporter substrate-binding protein [Desulfurivibrio sp.]